MSVPRYKCQTQQLFLLAAKDDLDLHNDEEAPGIEDEEVDHLGHCISFNGVAADPSKIACMVGWPTPTNIEGLRGFLGLTSYYHHFVRDYGKIAAPLTILLRKDQFGWSEDAEKAFDHLKKAMTTTPILALHNVSIPFVLEFDISCKGIRAILIQEVRPIAFFSKELLGYTLALSTYEMTAYPGHIQVETVFISNINEFLSYWGMITRHANVAADALSLQDHESHIHSLSTPRRALWQDIRTKATANEKLCKILAHVADDHTTIQGYSSHNVIGMTPFEAVYGCSPPNIATYFLGSTSLDLVDHDLRDRDALLKDLKDNIAKARNRMKLQHDQHHFERSFEVGDMVFLKLQQYSQVSLFKRSNQKLVAHFFGPYKVVKCLGPIAYRLELPQNTRLHLVFHVSLLKKYVGPNVVVNRTIPAVLDTGVISPLPRSILDYCWTRQDHKMLEKLMVQWDCLPFKDASWVERSQFKLQIPTFNLAGQGCFSRGGLRYIPM
ncbi:hypothetical protein HHK36_006355 [Tetracentron sinense]|uniref:Reverse transcriptase/retrotransposon-derived protein RNase H-like domain-containing protein n=1 Tax=Tetracentron sinense TaxID=13715 RepID=A0A834ZLD9_TETSI|nr:hypothetical protein HHK36_006355 [Tetracentron sinense]